MPEFSIAIIGAGGISRAHINAAKASNGRIEIAGIVDPSEAARKASGLPSFETIDALFASEAGKKLDGLVVCTPPSARIEYVQASLDRKLAVLTEKPIAHTLADAKKLCDLAAKYPTVVTAVGYCHRFTPAIIEMKKRIANNKIGEIVRFENTFASNQPRMKDHWMSDPKISGGGSCIDTGCHSLDLLLYLLGESRVKSASMQYAWPGRGESSSTLLLKAHGAASIINSGWLQPASFTVSVVGTRGSLHYDYNFATDLIFRPIEGTEQKLQVETHDVRFARQLQAFADAALGKPVSVKPTTFTEALQTAKAIDDAYRLAN